MAHMGLRTKKFTDYDWLDFIWQIDSQSIEKNTSTISWQMVLRSGAYGDIRSTASKTWSVTINGKKYSGTNTIQIGANSEKTLASGTETITHNNDGTKTLSFSFSQQIDITFSGVKIGTVSDSHSAELTSIPRQAAITSAPDFTDDDNPTIKYANPAGNSVDVLQACIASEDGITILVPYRDISKTSTSYTFNLTEAERNILRRTVSDTKSITVRFYIKFVEGEYSFLASLPKTLTIANCEPTLSPTVSDATEWATHLTGNNQIFIKNGSYLEFATGAQAYKGAKIVSQTVTCGTQTFSSTVNGNFYGQTANPITSNQIVFKATDTRGYTVQKTIDLDVVDYVPLTCVLKSSQPTTEGKLSFKINGSWFNGSFGAVYNTLSTYYRIRVNDETYGEWIGIPPTINGNKYSVNYTLTGLDYTATYTLQVAASDSVTWINSDEPKLTTIPVFSWNKENFEFNCDVNINGNLTINGNTTSTDYVIETGTEAMGSNGTWYWSKWNSGKVECYGCRNYGNMAVSTAWGGLYRSEAFNQDLPNELFVSTPDVIDITFRGAGNYGGWIARHEAVVATKTGTGSFIVVRPASATLSQAYISFNVIGRWK